VEWHVARGRNRRRVDKGGGPEPRRYGVRRARRALLALAVLAGVAAGGVQGWRAARSSGALRIATVRFEGLVHATADELLALSPVKPGDHLFLADVDAVERSLSRHPWVRRVEVRRTWPPALTVVVRERAAAALVDLGGLYLVDDEANVFKRAAAGDGLDLPLVTGIGRADYVQRRSAVEPLLASALALARAWREDGRDATARLSEIHVDPGDGTTIYVGEEGTQVRLGSGDLPAKLSRLEKVLSALRAEGKRAEVLHLDNRLHPSWVTVRLATAAALGVDGWGGRGPASPLR
jgi:cell division protein FtsQ